MIKTSLHSFAERIVDARAITAEDVTLLQRDILGSRLDQDQNATTLAKATAEAKLAASLS
jgi:hypothetical protein